MFNLKIPIAQITLSLVLASCSFKANPKEDSSTTSEIGRQVFEFIPKEQVFKPVSEGVITQNTAPITISNQSTESVKALKIVNFSSGQFTVIYNSCGETLEPGSSCIINIGYEPSSSIPVDDKLTLRFSVAGVVLEESTPISGMGGSGSINPDFGLSGVAAAGYEQ